MKKINIKKLNEKLEKVLNESYAENLKKVEEFGNQVIIPAIKNLFKDAKGLYVPDMTNTKIDMLDSFMSVTGFNLQPTAAGEMMDAEKVGVLKDELANNKNILEDKLTELGKQLEKELGFPCINSVFADQEEAGIELGGKKLYEEV